MGLGHSLRNMLFNALADFGLIYIGGGLWGVIRVHCLCWKFNPGRPTVTIPFNVRTYLPKLAAILLLVCNYIGKYRETILKYLPEGSETQVDAVLVACEALHIIVQSELPPDA